MSTNNCAGIRSISCSKGGGESRGDDDLSLDSREVKQVGQCSWHTLGPPITRRDENLTLSINRLGQPKVVEIRTYSRVQPSQDLVPLGGIIGTRLY